MANYYSNTRTNYFRVTDETKYAELFSHLVGDDDYIEDFTKTEDGITLHGFGCQGVIQAIPMDEDPEVAEEWDDDFDGFLKELQKILPDNEAFILTVVGHEKLCYLVGYSIIVTGNNIKSIDINEGAIELARTMLNDGTFTTQMDY